MLIFTILLPMIHRHVAAPLIGSERAALAGLFVLQAWLIVTSLFGLSLRWFNRHPPQAVKYVAEASFWIYLFHHPVVGLTQVSLVHTGWPVEVKYLITLASGLTLSLLTYHVLVRRTWIGVLLNGRRAVLSPAPHHADLLPLPDREPAPLRKSA